MAVTAGIENERQAVRALKSAAAVQAVLGGGVGVFGVVIAPATLIHHHSPAGFQGFVFSSYFPLGLAAALFALPLARRFRWAWWGSRGVTSALLLLPAVELMYSASYGDGGSYGPQVSLLLLLWVVPGRLFLGLLYRDGRAALKE